jgi:hypothetical protein
MVLKMQHGSMKKLCGRNTHNFLSILKKIEAKNARLHFWAARVPEPHLRILGHLHVDSPDKRMVQPDGLREVKGAHSLGQQVERERDYGWNCCWRVKIA